MGSTVLFQGDFSNILITLILGVMFLSGFLLFKTSFNQRRAARTISEISAYTAFLLGAVYSWYVFSTGGGDAQSNGLLQHDELQAILIPYMLFMGVIVKRFSYSYLQSDEFYPRFLMTIKWLVGVLVLLVTANHVALQALAWVAASWLMYYLLRHTQSSAAKQSARLSVETFIIGDVLFVASMLALTLSFGSPFISEWGLVDASMYSGSSLVFLVGALLALTLGLFTKLSCLPFHTWLPKTLTAPTPVSALMHAGFVNSGAIILAKLSALLIQLPVVSYVLIIAGLISALYGSFVMLVQTDVKRYLTYSTIGQMGFMILECGLGAYHLALAHLMIHGFFKARLFLTSGSVIEHRTAIRHAKLHAPSSGTLSKNLLHLFVLTSLTAFTWWFAHSVSTIGFVLDHLPVLLVAVLGSALVITQQTILRVKGLSAWSIGTALLFGLALLFGYGYYEIWASSVLPHYNLTEDLQEVPVYWVLLAMYLLTSLGAVLHHIGIGVIPAAFSRKIYMFFTSTSMQADDMTFTHR